MRIQVLGPTAVASEGNSIRLDGHKLRSLVAILAIRRGDVVGRDELIEELALTESTQNAVNALHAHITRLRRWLRAHELPADLVETSGTSGYRIDIERSQVDAWQFIDTVEQAADLTAKTPLVAATVLEDALALWRGEALRDVVDSDGVRRFSEQLYAVRCHAQEALLTAWMDLGRLDRIALHGRRFIKDNPLNERLWELMIEAAQRAGRTAEAVALYNDLKGLLSRELGVLPDPRIARSVQDLNCA
ncbi:AfsR/SARP family transcriptional regulator [Nocardia veterana]|uniref:AfsR/SARP family transcriptional regulator n=1 Tax=Nocardia veterana TaxID=132249 RepID=UPI001461340B|nr:BTAD domain-containing putative transcriptional regulator [Nocardia veterana]